MPKYAVIIFAAIVVIVVVIFLVFTAFEAFKKQKTLVVCIMITGKNACREHFAKRAIDNFYEQDYPNKRLVIINHSPDYRVLQSDKSDMIYEFHVPKTPPTTLGDLRNIALAMVPPDAIWTTWDDDDYRAPDYLSIMLNALNKTNADVLAFKHRTEYNINNGFVWNIHLETGFPLLFAKQDMRVLYKRQDTMEDTDMLSNYRKLGKKITIHDNDPRLYIRLVHGSNTSLYVDRNKEHVASTTSAPSTASPSFPYSENTVSESESERVQNLVNNFYSEGIACSKSSTYN